MNGFQGKKKLEPVRDANPPILIDQEKTKICSSCKIEKLHSEFNIHKKQKDGRNYLCRECQSIQQKKNYAKRSKRKIQIDYNALKQCSICKIIQPGLNFSKVRASKDGLSTICKECDNAIQRERRKKDLDRLNQVQRERYAKDNEKHIQYARDYRKRNKEKTVALAMKWARENPEKRAKICHDRYVREMETVVGKLNHIMAGRMNHALRKGKGGKTWSAFTGYSCDTLGKVSTFGERNAHIP